MRPDTRGSWSQRRCTYSPVHCHLYSAPPDLGRELNHRGCVMHVQSHSSLSFFTHLQRKSSVRRRIIALLCCGYSGRRQKLLAGKLLPLWIEHCSFQTNFFLPTPVRFNKWRNFLLTCLGLRKVFWTAEKIFAISRTSGNCGWICNSINSLQSACNFLFRQQKNRNANDLSHSLYLPPYVSRYACTNEIN